MDYYDFCKEFDISDKIYKEIEDFNKRCERNRDSIPGLPDSILTYLTCWFDSL